MSTVTRTFETKAEAKKVLHKIFGVGIYTGNGLYASARFASGQVEKNADGYTCSIRSNYFTEYSLEKAFEVGIDAI